MFASYVFDQVSANENNRLILVDHDSLFEMANVQPYFESRGFNVIIYRDDLHFRTEQEIVLTDQEERFLLLVKPSDYVPYDVWQLFSRFDLSYYHLFPKLNTSTLKDSADVNVDLLYLAYLDNYSVLRSERETQAFIKQEVYSRRNIEKYVDFLANELAERVKLASTYKDWFAIAETKARIDTFAVEYNITCSSESIQSYFKDHILNDFGKLSSVIDRNSPILVSRAMEYMRSQSEKFVIIVMDGMSEFDWQIISKSFEGIRFEKTHVFAMIPTTTSISRQCLLSNKFPSQLLEPWKQSKEKLEFTECAKRLGYTDTQIAYSRGYDVTFGLSIKCAAIINNDIDEMVHGQKQGRKGMFSNVSLLAQEGQLASLSKQLLEQGFDVYITSDHGNTPCVGVGRLMKTGVEVETKSRRMIVLRDFADKQTLADQNKLIDYPKYYLNKDYDYLLCDAGISFDPSGDHVMSHGGITIDEVVVPFIKIKADSFHG